MTDPVELIESNKGRVAMIVEDELLVRMELADALEEAGWKILEAGTGDEVAALLPQFSRIDVLVTDIRLSGSATGWEVAEMVRAKFPNVAVIYASANPPIESRQVSDSAFVSKPTRMAMLLAIAERFWQSSSE